MSIAFSADRILDPAVRAGGFGGITLEERVVEPFHKDYDALPGNHPADWARTFDLSTWGVFSAWRAGARVGGAVVAWATPELHLLEGRSDLAALWDLRVAPFERRSGVGAALFAAACAWAAERRATWLKVETQNVNLAACRFYRSQGCELGGIERFAYPQLPDEVRLTWYRRL